MAPIATTTTVGLLGSSVDNSLSDPFVDEVRNHATFPVLSYENDIPKNVFVFLRNPIPRVRSGSGFRGRAE
jgi:hypothetical protein